MDGSQHKGLLSGATRARSRRSRYIKVKPEIEERQEGEGKTQWRVDGADVRSAYHRAILAAVATARLDTAVEDVVLVGLGGGALATALQALLPSVNIRVVELDEAVVDVAERWFGFSRAGVDVTVGDGLAAFDDAAAAAAADVVVIDVDAKDASLGMSCRRRRSWNRPTCKR